MKPTIAHVRNVFLPVSETFIYQVLTAARETVPVAFCAERQNESLFAWDDVVCVGYPGRFSAQKLMTMLRRVSGIQRHASSMTGRYRDAFRARRPDLVHAHFGVEGAQVMDACQELGLPLVVSFHGFDVSQVPRDPVMRRTYTHLFRIASRVIALSEDFRHRLLALGCPGEKVAVIYVGVDPTMFPYRAPDISTERPVRFVGAGRLVEKKGTRYTIAALAQVRRTHPGISYTHVGGGPLEEELKAQAAQLSVDEICDFRGVQPHAELRAQLQAGDVFVLPSVKAANGDEEGMPGTIYESMATGLPILSTRHSGIPEVVEEGGNGYLAPERDAAALAANMIRMIENRSEWIKMAECGRSLIVDRFDQRQAVAKLEQVYREELKSGKGR